MLAYPTEADAFTALSVALGPITNHQINLPQEAHAVWVLGGYALARALPDPQPASVLTDVLLSLLQKFLGNLDWQAIGTALLKMLMDWLGKVVTPPAPVPRPSPFEPPTP